MFYRNLIVIILFMSLFISSLQARSLMQKAKYAFSNGELNKAYSLFEQLSNNNPTNGVSYFYRGYIREQQKKKGTAIQHYTKALDLRLPKELREKTFWKVVLYYKENRNWGELLRYSDKFLSFNKHSSIKKLKALAQQNYNSNEFQGNKLLREAKADIKDGAIENAETKLNKILFSYPFYQDALWELALLQMKKKEYAQALRHLKKLIQSNSKNWQVYYKASLCAFHTAKYDASLFYLKTANNLHEGDKKSFNFYYNFILGKIYLEKGEYSLALKKLKKASAIRQTQSLDMALALTYWNLRKYKQSQFHAKEVIDTNDSQPKAFLILAMCKWNEKNKEAAFSWANKMKASIYEYINTEENQNKKTKLASYSLGFLILAKEKSIDEDWRLAIKYYAKVNQKFLAGIIKTQAEQALGELAQSFAFEYARALMYDNQAQLALRYYKNIKKNQLKNPLIYYEQARCYGILLQEVNAKKYLKKAVAMEPKLWNKIKRDDVFETLARQSEYFQDFIEDGPE